MNELEAYQQLAFALGVGLLIGLERGWQRRDTTEGARVAGFRTYGLIGLLGGVCALLARETHIILLGLTFIGLVLVTIAAYYHRIKEQDDIGITSIIATLLTFVLGALCGMGHVQLAVPAAVVITALLSFKPVLHRFIQQIEREELYATMKLLLISVVILPVLPNQTYDPWDALNPYQIWWMVVLIAAISFVGYFAVKITGARQGALITGIFGGLASSTAVTLHLSRMGRAQPELSDATAAGILAACATMFPRLLIITVIFNPALFNQLLIPLLVISVIMYLAVIIFWQRSAQGKQPQSASIKTTLRNPFSLSVALKFGLLLAVIMLLSRFLTLSFGNIGIYVLAAASGIADVDAIALSITNMVSGLNNISLDTASKGILIAAFVNSMVKAGIALFIGQTPLGVRVGVAMLLALGSGLFFI